MQSIDLAAIVAAGTALVLAPIDPQPLHDSPPAPEPTLSPLAVLLAHTEAQLAATVRTALGMPGRQMREDEGETARRVGMWSQHELNNLYERVGGTITIRTVHLSTHGGETTWKATEIVVTVDLPGIGAVEIVTNWDEESGGRDLPLVQNIPAASLIPA